MVSKTEKGTELRFNSTNEGCPSEKDTLLETKCIITESGSRLIMLNVSTKKQRGLIVLPNLKPGSYNYIITEYWSDKRTAPFAKKIKGTFEIK